MYRPNRCLTALLGVLPVLVISALIARTRSAHADALRRTSHAIVGTPILTPVALSAITHSNTTPPAEACRAPREAYDQVEAGGIDTYRICFTGRRRAEVTVEGDGDTDLDCYVRSSAGHVVDSDTDATDYCILSWQPSQADVYRLEIRNPGSVYNAYYLRTN